MVGLSIELSLLDGLVYTCLHCLHCLHNKPNNKQKRSQAELDLVLVVQVYTTKQKQQTTKKAS